MLTKHTQIQTALHPVVFLIIIQPQVALSHRSWNFLSALAAIFLLDH